MQTKTCLLLGILLTLYAPMVFSYSDLEKVFLSTITTVEANNCPILVIKSKSGIGKLKLTGLNKYKGKKLILRLHLQALESFRFVTEKLCFRSFISTSTGKAYQTLSDSPIGLRLNISKSNSMRFRITNYKKLNYIEIEIPPTVTQYFDKSVEISWIDFYR